MGALSPVAKQQFFDNNGNLAVGFKLYTYTTNTTTPLATYTDAALTTPNANPIILDSRGECVIYLQGALYRYVLKDASDATIWTRDGIASPLYQGALGGTSPIIVANVAALNTLTGMSNDALATTLGYYTDNDGGHGTYRYDSASVATVNGFTVINAAGGVGRWLLLEAEPNFNQAGAKGDGITNDQAAIQAACTAMAGKVIRAVPGYNYKFNSNVSVPADTVIWAFGAKFDCSSSHFTAFTFANGGGIIGAEEIKGAGNASYNAAGVAIYCTGVNNHPSAPTVVNGPVVMYNKIKEWGSYGVYVIYCNKTKVDYNEITKIGYSALGGVSQNDGSFCNNYVNDVSPGSGGGDAYGAFFDRFNGTSETSDPRSYRCKMNNNVVRGVVATTANNGHALDTHGGVEIEIIGNKIEGCEGGIFVTSSSISGSEALGPKRCIVANNTINCGLYNNYALIVRGAINGSTVAEYADSNVVAGNAIFGGGAAGSNTTGAIMLQATKNTRIDVGSIMQARPFGVCLNSDNLNFNISGGTISDCFDDSVTIAGGVAVRGNNNKGFIGGISFKYETAGLGTYVMVNSVVISGGLTGLDIDMGRCYFEGIDASHLAFNDGVGVNSESLYGHSKTESFTLTSGNSSTIKSVVFPKRFPVAPKITLTNAGAISPGGKTMALRTSAITTTGFDIIAYPSDLTTWSATASADINWRATT